MDENDDIDLRISSDSSVTSSPSSLRFIRKPKMSNASPIPSEISEVEDDSDQINGFNNDNSSKTVKANTFNEESRESCFSSDSSSKLKIVEDDDSDIENNKQSDEDYSEKDDIEESHLLTENDESNLNNIEEKSNSSIVNENTQDIHDVKKECIDEKDENCNDFYGFDETEINQSVEKLSNFKKIMGIEDCIVKQEFNETPSIDQVQTIESSGDNAVTSSNSLSLNGSKSVRKTYCQYVCDPPVNIFSEEVIPVGSKRTIKKRQFFGDFIDPDIVAGKKPSSNRLSHDSPKIVHSENKENVVTDDKTEKNNDQKNVAEPVISTPITNTINTHLSQPDLQNDQVKPKRSATFNITNPMFKVPFKYGWIREIVYRDLPKDSKSKTAYVAYFSPMPNRRKYKTIRHIVENLPEGSELTKEHFTFSKERIFTGPNNFEMIRHMVKKELDENCSILNNSFYTPGSNPKFIGKLKRKAIPTINVPIKKPKYLQQNEELKEDDDHTDTSSTLLANDSGVHEIHLSPTVNKGSIKMLIPNTRPMTQTIERKLLSKKSLNNSEVTESLVKINGNVSKCSISCPLALGEIPTLQCSICLDSYHFKCCGLDVESKKSSSKYICKKCSSTSENSATDIPISSFCSNNLTSLSNNIRPMFSETTTGPMTVIPVTTTTIPPVLQSVIQLNGKRYIIVPKNSTNFNSIQPTNITSSTILLEQRAENVYEKQNTPYSPDSSNNTGVNVQSVDNGNKSLLNSGFSKRNNSNEISENELMRKQMRWHNNGTSSLTLTNISAAYSVFIMCCKYLEVHDILRMSQTCRFLNRVATESCLWTSVKMKNSLVFNWNGFADSLNKYKTKKLDLKKMLIPPLSSESEVWNNFLRVVPTITSLEHIEFMRCDTSIVEKTASVCPNLKVVLALQLRNEISLEKFANLKNLRELKLKSANANKHLVMKPCDNFEFESINIEILSITGIKMMNTATLNAIGKLHNLNVLELGECTNETISANQIATALGQLKNLKGLRLESVENLETEASFQDSLKKLEHLKWLELINIDVKEGFEQVLSACGQIDHLLIIPTYDAGSASTTRAILNGLQHLSETLKTFKWCITTELINSTYDYFNNSSAFKFDDENEADSDEKKAIPIAKYSDTEYYEDVELLSREELNNMLNDVLPNTNINLLTLPHAHTWRQYLPENCKTVVA